MLKHLSIKNYAIIDKLELDLYNGMTVLTGETGAGKSIIVDAILLLLGERASKEMISSSKNSAEVIGTFVLDNKKIKNILKKYEIDFDEEIVISRIISKDNRNIIKINNQNTSIKVLKELALYLADIHSQFDTSKLINPENYLSLVDNFRKEKTKIYISDYKDSLNNYKKELSNYYKLLQEKEDTLAQLDLYQFQLNELSNLCLELDEEESLNEKINLLENVDKINTVLETFNSSMNEGELLDRIYMLKNDLDSISATSSDFKSLSERLNDVYYELSDIQQSLTDKLENLEYNQADYDELIIRLNSLEKIKSKYNKSIKELIKYQAFLEEEVEKANNYDEIILEQHTLVKQKYEQLLSDALKLRSFRKDLAKKITKEIKETLRDLVILNADFEIRFDEALPKDELDDSLFKENGIDRIDFYISTNLGQPLKPLSKTASGGEMSRVMLAFKSIFVRSNQISTIIFDEIDTGISGYIAKQIANKIQEIAKICQVISITHIPQVVATGTHHISVKKKIIDNSTKITVSYLNYEERVLEIAKMISTGKISEASIESAKELLISG